MTQWAKNHVIHAMQTFLTRASTTIKRPEWTFTRWKTKDLLKVEKVPLFESGTFICMNYSLDGIFMKVVNQRTMRTGYLCRFDLWPSVCQSLVMNYFGSNISYPVSSFFLEYSFCMSDSSDVKHEIIKIAFHSKTYHVCFSQFGCADMLALKPYSF